MELSEMLALELSARNTDRIAHYIGDDKQLFAELMRQVFIYNPTIQLRASWVVSRITDKFPYLLVPYLKKVIDYLPNFKHNGINRNLLRQITLLTIPENLQGKLYSICYSWLSSKEQPVAVKSHCIQILYNISSMEPELKKELSLILENMADDCSAGIRSKCHHILKDLRNKG